MPFVSRTCRAQGQEVYENSVGMKFVSVPEGEFEFGPHTSPYDLAASDGDAITIPISSGLRIQQHEVSVRLFAQFCREENYVTVRQRDIRLGNVPSDGESLKEWRASDSELPMSNVTLEDCITFCKWLSEKETRIYRLPTEIEWEYCCLLGSKGRTPQEQFTPPVAWIGRWQLGDDKPEGLPLGEFRDGPRRVDAGAADSLSLYNMRGNVQEICDSWYHARTKLQSPSKLTGRVIALVVRGGSWTRAPMWAQAKQRSWHNALRYSDSTGFRVILDERKADVTTR